MTIDIVLPFRIFGRYSNVRRIVVETSAGSYGILPNRLDFVSSLVPGILEFETTEGIHYVAVASGVCIKCGSKISVSVHNAYGNAPLGELKRKVVDELTLQESEFVSMRSVLARLEGGFVRSLQKLKE